MRRLFFHLLKRYIRTERDRLAILQEVFGGVQQDYYEQTMPGNIHNFTIEILLANPWVREAVHSDDKGTMQIIRNTIFAATSEAFVQIKNEERTAPMELKIGWHRVEQRKGLTRSK